MVLKWIRGERIREKEKGKKGRRSELCKLRVAELQGETQSNILKYNIQHF